MKIIFEDFDSSPISCLLKQSYYGSCMLFCGCNTKVGQMLKQVIRKNPKEIVF